MADHAIFSFSDEIDTMAFSLTRVFSDLPDITIIDVGASSLSEDAKPEYQPLLDTGKARVIGFEPNADAAPAIPLGNGNVMILPYAIGDGSDGVMHENAYPMTSSLYESNHALLDHFQQLGEFSTTLKKTPIKTVRLEDIPEIDQADIIFLDVQGAALDVLQAAGRVLDMTGVLHVEVEFVEMYKNQPLFGDVDRFLRQENFFFHTFFYMGTRCLKPTVINNNPIYGLKQRLWADAVYIHHFMEPDKLADEQLLKMAWVLNDVYGSWDFCFYFLNEFDKRHGGKRAPQYMDALSDKYT